MKKTLSILTVLAILLCCVPAVAEIPRELAGKWQGTGTPKNGGPSIDLTAEINADGSGQYTFEQAGYRESYPFTVSSSDSTFSVDIPATSGLGSVAGTWALEDGVLVLDITTTFPNGRTYSYIARCERVTEEAAAVDMGETAEYADAVISFRYPAAWNCGVAYDGSIILEITGSNSAVIVAAMISDLVSYTGDRETDAPAIEKTIAEYSLEKQEAKGKNLTLNGAYEMKQVGDMRGFRALGTWRATGQDLVMTTLSGDRHLVSFTFIGDEAIPMEDALLSTVTLLGSETQDGGAGFRRWQGAGYSLDYPEAYAVQEASVGVVFIDPEDKNNLIMARTYSLDFDYSDELAVPIAAQALPKSTKVEPNAVMETAGDWNTAVIRGQLDAGPMAFYIIGSGRTAMALMFTGEGAVGMAEAVVASAAIE